MATSVEVVKVDLEKKYGIERSKLLGATVFEGTTNPIDVVAWLNLMETCFRAM